MDQKIMAERVVKEIPVRYPSPNPSRPVRVCAYVRVSTGHTAQMDSLQNQTEYYNSKLANHPGYTFVGVYSDAGISGAKETRPGFQAMLEKARAGELDLIYTKSLSRFARNTLMLLSVVRELKAIGVGIIFEAQNINTLRTEGELMLTILAGIAEEERRSVRTNIQWSMQKRFLRGEVMVDANRLIGYNKDESGKLIIIPEQAEIVQTIFRLYLSGVTGYKIAQMLNEQNIPSYTNQPWGSNRILRIISNAKYMGACMMQKSFVAENGKQVINRGQRDRYWVEYGHPAIISREDWYQAQLIRKGRVKKVYPFTGLLRCAFCGSTLIRVILSGGYVSWICSRYLHLGKAACIGSRIPEPCLILMTKDQPITEPMIVEEEYHGPNKKNRPKKNYYLTPLSTRT